MATNIENMSLEAGHPNSSNAQEPITEQELQQVDQKVRECTAILGVAIDRMLDDTPIIYEEEFDDVPTILYASVPFVSSMHSSCLTFVLLAF